MIPLELNLHNFMSYQNARLDLRGINLAVLSGSNGAGKSTLLEAITWVLWGKTRANSDDELIHQGQLGMWSELIFDLGGNQYRVIRKRDIRKKGTTVLEFQIASKNKKSLGMETDWKSLTEPTIKETQNLIINILKLPYEIFINSSYLRQGHADEFTIKAPTERKEVLSKILDLEYYDRLQQQAKEKAKENQAKTQALEYGIEEIKLKLQEKDGVLRAYKLALEEQRSLQKRLAEIDEQRKRTAQAKNLYEVLEAKLEAARERYRQISGQIVNYQSQKEAMKLEIINSRMLIKNKTEIQKQYLLFEKITKQNEIFNFKERQGREVREKLVGQEHLREKLKQDIQRIQHISTCPTCLRKMTEIEAKKIIKTLRRDFDLRHGQEIIKLEGKIRKIGYDHNKHQEIQNQITKLQNVAQQKHQIELVEQTIKNNLDNLRSLEKESQKAENELKESNLEGRKLKNQQDKLKPAFLQFEKIENEISEVKSILSMAEMEVGRLKGQKDELENLEKQKYDKQKEFEEITKLATIFEELATAFGKNGLQAMIIGETLPALEEESNQILGRLTGGKMNVSFATERPKKSSEEMIETLDIKITDEMGERPYELFSGGEAFRINFGVRVALAKLLSRRAGAKLQFLVIDEGFGTLDQAGQEDLVSAINSIRDDFAKILVVTHVRELKDIFPTQIEVFKNEHGSQIKVIQA